MRVSQRNVLLLLAMKYPRAAVVPEDQELTAEELEEHGYLQARKVKDANGSDRLECKITPGGATWFLTSSFVRFVSDEKKTELETLAAENI